MKALHVLRLMETLSEKTGEPLEGTGFNNMSKAIDGEAYISRRYLYDLYRNSSQKCDSGLEKMKAYVYLLDTIAQHMDFTNFNEFAKSCEQIIPNSLKSCIGNWWSYVRANSGDFVLKAPVKIFIDMKRNIMSIEMKGKERIFSGQIEEKGGCLSGFMESGIDKRIGLVFKMGSSRQIELLQGVFCGMSSSGDPIAGRELLVREYEIPYERMSWSRNLLSSNELDQKIKKYFAKEAVNCIKIKDVKGFSLEDLDG